MSLWWISRDQLDDRQVSLIEGLPLGENHLILGPPGSGKTNVLLRRAQFVRSQDLTNVLVLTFTRSLTEFVKTGCFDAQRREIFPQSCVRTIEGWIRELYALHEATRPNERAELGAYKAELAQGAMEFSNRSHLPRYEALFVDEAQDLLPEEIDLIRLWSSVCFFVGDEKQKIFDADGLGPLRDRIDNLREHHLRFHYRLAPEICRMADRILISPDVGDLSSTSLYNGPQPGRIDINGPLSRDDILNLAAERIGDQIRAYADFINNGDRIGVIVARKADREVVFRHLESIGNLAGRAKIIRAREDGEGHAFDPSFDGDKPICIMTVKACKGLEFRAVHWLFCEELRQYHNREHYYTVVTRAKTSLDIYYCRDLPRELAGAYSRPATPLW